jgi:hypothetical protein
LLPPPPGWIAPQPPPPYAQAPYGPVIVNQHYYLAPPPPGFPQLSRRPNTSSGPLTSLRNQFTLQAVADLAEELYPGSTSVPRIFDSNAGQWHGYSNQLLGDSAALYDQLSASFNNVMTRIDGDRYDGHENELFMLRPGLGQPQGQSPQPTPQAADMAMGKKDQRTYPRDHPKGQTTAVAASVVSGNYFAKVELYGNSRLPMSLPPLRL